MDKDLKRMLYIVIIAIFAAIILFFAAIFVTIYGYFGFMEIISKLIGDILAYPFPY